MSDSGLTVANPEQLDAFVVRQALPVWAMLDGVSCKDLPALAQGNEGACLYKSQAGTNNAHAPWLLRLPPQGSLKNDLQLLPPDMHWGFIFASGEPLESLRAHFRRFTMVWVDGVAEVSDAPVYFRFYDPRVMLDCLDVLHPDHLSALLAPVAALALPLSPLLGARTGLSPFASREEFRGKVIVADCRHTDQGQPLAGTFRISALEYRDFSRAQQRRASRKLARELKGMYPNVPDDHLIEIARTAPDAAASYGLSSVRQVWTYAECMLWHGSDFDRLNADARQLLSLDDHLAWRKSERLSDWLTSTKAGHVTEDIW